MRANLMAFSSIQTTPANFWTMLSTRGARLIFGIRFEIETRTSSPRNRSWRDSQLANAKKDFDSRSCRPLLLPFFFPFFLLRFFLDAVSEYPQCVYVCVDFLFLLRRIEGFSVLGDERGDLFAVQVERTSSHEFRVLAVFFLSISVSFFVAVAGIVLASFIDGFLIGVDFLEQPSSSQATALGFLGNRKRVHDHGFKATWEISTRKIHHRDAAGVLVANWIPDSGRSPSYVISWAASEWKRFLENRCDCGSKKS